MHDPCRASTNRPLSLSLSLSRPHLLLRCFPFHLYVFSISPTLCPSSLLFSPRGIPVDTDTGGARSTRQRVLNGVQRRQRGGYEKEKWKKREKERESASRYVSPLFFFFFFFSSSSKVFLCPSLPPPFKLYNRSLTRCGHSPRSLCLSSSRTFASFLAPL